MKLTLKSARVNAGYTQEDAAKELNITPQTLRSYEKGNSFPEVPTLKKIEALYGVHYDDLIFIGVDTV